MWGLSQRLSKDMQNWSTAQIFVTQKLGSHDSWVTPKLNLNYSALVVMQLTPYLSQDCNSYHLETDHDKNPTLVENHSLGLDCEEEGQVQRKWAFV
jgi:hypothetical protein